MIQATIRMLIPSKRRGEVMEILGSIAGRCRFEPGCMGCRVYQDAEEKQVIMLEELWRDEESLKHHLRSDEYRRVLLVVEMAQEYPEIRFNTISYSAGLEAIEKARNLTGRTEGP
jgi:quinol monooxygenase YgiN